MSRHRLARERSVSLVYQQLDGDSQGQMARVVGEALGQKMLNRGSSPFVVSFLIHPPFTALPRLLPTLRWRGANASAFLELFELLFWPPVN